MSPLVTRPSLPEPGTAEASMPLSAASLRTEGASGASARLAFRLGIGLRRHPRLRFFIGGIDRRRGGGFLIGPAGGARQILPRRAPAPSLIWPSSAPTATVSPSLAAISDSTPAAGAGTSIVTLSVSSSTTGSSAATASPARLNHLPMVASVTDSPRVGTRISAMCSLFFASCQACAGIPLQREDVDGRDKPGHDKQIIPAPRRGTA